MCPYQKTAKGEAERTEFSEWNRQTDEEKFYNFFEKGSYILQTEHTFSEEIKGPDDTCTWSFQKMLDDIPHALKKQRCSGTRKTDKSKSKV